MVIGDTMKISQELSTGHIKETLMMAQWKNGKFRKKILDFGRVSPEPWPMFVTWCYRMYKKTTTHARLAWALLPI